MCASKTTERNELPSELLERSSSHTSYTSSTSGQSGSQATSGAASAPGSRCSSLSDAHRREPEPKVGLTQTIRDIAAQSQLSGVGTSPQRANLQDLLAEQNNGRSPVAPPPPPLPQAEPVNPPPTVSPSAASPKPSPKPAPAPKVPSEARPLPPPTMPKPKFRHPDTRARLSPRATNPPAAAAALDAQCVNPAIAAQAPPVVLTSAVGPAAPQAKTDTLEESSGSCNTVVAPSNRRGPQAATGPKPLQSAEDGRRPFALFATEDPTYKDTFPSPQQTARSPPPHIFREAAEHEHEMLAARVRVAPDEHVKYANLMQVQPLAEWATIKSQIGAMLLTDRKHYEGIRFMPTAKLDDKQMREKTDPFLGNLTGGLCVALVRRNRHLQQQPVYFAFWTDFFNSAVRCVELENEPLRFVEGASKQTVFRGEYPHFLGAIAAVHDEASRELRHLVVVESCAQQLVRQMLSPQCAGSSLEDEQRVDRQGGTAANAAEKQTGPHRISILVLRGADRQSDNDGLRFEPHCSIRLGDTNVGCHTNACAIGARVFASYSHSSFVFRIDVDPSGDGLGLQHVDVGSNVRCLASDPKLQVVAALLLDGLLCILNETLVPLTKYAIRAGEVPFIRRLHQVSSVPKLIAFMRLGTQHRPSLLVVFHHKLKAARAAAENGARNGRDSDKRNDSIDVYDVLSGEWLSRLSPEELKPLAALCVFPSEKTRIVPAASAATAVAGDRGFLVSYLDCLSVRTFYERDANSSQTATATPFINTYL